MSKGTESIRPTGTLGLRSGLWRWELHPAHNGISILFRHRRRTRDEMHAWVADASELTGEAMTLLARDPVTRVWVDVVGLRWELSIEKKRSALNESSTAWLVFERGGARWMVTVSADQHLGDLTHWELQQLLELA